MIKNEREYKISKGWLEKFASSLETARNRKPKDKNDAERLKVRIAGLESQYEGRQTVLWSILWLSYRAY
jgi:hypothetical protein